MGRGASTTEVTIIGAPWKVRGAIPSNLDDPTNDTYGEVIGDRNHRHSIHLAAGIVCGPMELQSSKELTPSMSEVFGDARSLRGN